jgi:hypothetical protein
MLRLRRPLGDHAVEVERTARAKAMQAQRSKSSTAKT